MVAENKNVDGSDVIDAFLVYLKSRLGKKEFKILIQSK